MARKRKFPASEFIPVGTPSSAVDSARAIAETLIQFCQEHEVTLVMGLSAYDRLMATEPRSFVVVGPPSSAMGLTQALLEEAAEVADDADIRSTEGTL